LQSELACRIDPVGIASGHDTAQPRQHDITSRLTGERHDPVDAFDRADAPSLIREPAEQFVIVARGTAEVARGKHVYRSREAQLEKRERLIE
jgi:hypothetical protein